MVTIVRAAARRAEPWANGLGITSEVISWPPGTNLASFAWRVSVADMVTHSNFSALPGIDRTLVALSGDGIALIVDGQSVGLDAFDIARFSGDSAVSGGPRGAATRDLNVMVRRGAAETKVTVVRPVGVQVLHPGPDERLLVFVAEGEAALGNRGVALMPGDAVLIDDTVSLRGDGIIIRISARVPASRLSRISDPQAANRYPMRP